MSTSVPPAVARAWMRACAQPAGASGTASIESAPSSGRSTMAVTQGIAGYRIASAKTTPTTTAPATIAKRVGAHQAGLGGPQAAAEVGRAPAPTATRPPCTAGASTSRASTSPEVPPGLDDRLLVDLVEAVLVREQLAGARGRAPARRRRRAGSATNSHQARRDRDQAERDADHAHQPLRPSPSARASGSTGSDRLEPVVDQVPAARHLDAARPPRRGPPARPRARTSPTRDRCGRVARSPPRARVPRRRGSRGGTCRRP